MSQPSTTPEQYHAWYDTPRGRWIGDLEYAIVRGLLGEALRGRILDVGCGTGWFTRRLAGDGADVAGLDHDGPALAFACDHAPARATFVRGDAQRLPFTDASFDAAVAVTTLCFVADWPRALSEMVRVARKRVVVGLLHRHSLHRLQKGRGGGTGAYRGAHWHTRAEVAAALATLPVRNVRYRYAVFLPSGSAVARAVERVVPRSAPFGAFLALAADVAGGK